MFKSRLKQLVLEKSAREGQRITQRDVARACDLQEVTIHKWMSDEPMTRIDAYTVNALSRYFGVAWNELVEFVGEEKPSPKKRTYSVVQPELSAAG